MGKTHVSILLLDFNHSVNATFDSDLNPSVMSSEEKAGDTMTHEQFDH